jgi:heat shock protein HslJ
MVAAFGLLLISGFACQAAASDLQGSAWRLLNITSMDDSVTLSNEPNSYTLSFDAEGRVAIKADCNSGSGSWSSKTQGQLKFGPIAATRARCLPESLSQKYLAQFEWVRSYTMRDGHLFLATMADGSIIEFEPLPPVVAIALGENIHAADAPELQALLVTRLLDRYAAEQAIEVADSELKAYLESMRRGMAKEGLTAEEELSPAEVLQVDGMRRQLAYAMIRQWKINKSLYQTYGGRIIYQQLGPEPLDAYRQYFEKRQSAGDFTIFSPAMAEYFWAYFSDESRHDFMPPGGKDEADAFSLPPWR